MSADKNHSANQENEAHVIKTEEFVCDVIHCLVVVFVLPQAVFPSGRRYSSKGTFGIAE